LLKWPNVAADIDAESDFRRLAESVQPVTQAHDGMFPHHARPGVAHHRLDLFAARALVAVDGALGAGWLLRAEAAAFQPRGGIIQ